jgi:hypothetical protein
MKDRIRGRHITTQRSVEKFGIFQAAFSRAIERIWIQIMHVSLNRRTIFICHTVRLTFQMQTIRSIRM